MLIHASTLIFKHPLYGPKPFPQEKEALLEKDTLASAIVVLGTPNYFTLGPRSDGETSIYYKDYSLRITIERASYCDVCGTGLPGELSWTDQVSWIVMGESYDIDSYAHPWTGKFIRYIR